MRRLQYKGGFHFKSLKYMTLDYIEKMPRIEGFLRLDSISLITIDNPPLFAGFSGTCVSLRA